MKHYEYQCNYTENGIKTYYKIFDIIADTSIDAFNIGHNRFIKSMNGDNIFGIKSKDYIVITEKIRLVKNYSKKQ